MKFTFDGSEKTRYEFLMSMIRALLLIAISVAVLIWLLSGFLWLTELLVDCFGYSFVIPSGAQTAAITVSGTLIVALVALFGVYRQNLSAEKRHRVDANLAFKKDIFLRVAEAFSIQYEYILSFANPAITDEDRVALISGYSKEFYKLHLVASEQTILAMLEVNEEWMKAIIDVALTKGKGELVGIDFFNYLISISHNFMKKLWEFNVIARSEFENNFIDNDSYLLEMEKSYSKLISTVNNLKLKIEENDL